MRKVNLWRERTAHHSVYLEHRSIWGRKAKYKLRHMDEDKYGLFFKIIDNKVLEK